MSNKIPNISVDFFCVKSVIFMEFLVLIQSPYVLFSVKCIISGIVLIKKMIPKKNTSNVSKQTKKKKTYLKTYFALFQAFVVIKKITPEKNTLNVS